MIASILHFMLTGLFGIAIIQYLKKPSLSSILILQGLAIGFLAETMISFLLYFIGIHIWVSFILMAPFIGYSLYKKWSDYSEYFFRILIKFREHRITLTEVIISTVLLEKIIFAGYMVLSIPVYFEDTMMHWAGRGKALYFGTNFSMDPSSPLFMGRLFGHKQYPLLLSLWKVNTAHIGGDWTDTYALFDSYLFYLILIASTVIVVYHLTNRILYALISIIIITSVPLNIWHSAHGMADMALLAISVLAIWSIYKKEYLITGLLLAALAWIKNEGLLIFAPVYILGLIIYNFDLKSRNIKLISRALGLCLIGLIIPLLPWQIFRWYTGLSMSTPIKTENYYHPDSLQMFGKFTFDNPANSFFWVFVVAGLILGSSNILKNRLSFSLLIMLFAHFLLLIYIFCFTGAHIFMANQMTIHRSLMQIVPLACILIFSLFAETNKL